MSVISCEAHTGREMTLKEWKRHADKKHWRYWRPEFLKRRPEKPNFESSLFMREEPISFLWCCWTYDQDVIQSVFSQSNRKLQPVVTTAGSWLGQNFYPIILKVFIQLIMQLAIQHLLSPLGVSFALLATVSLHWMSTEQTWTPTSDKETVRNSSLTTSFPLSCCFAEEFYLGASVA